MPFFFDAFPQGQMVEPRWLSYKQAHAWEAEAKAHDVSQVARSARGFMRAYEKHGTAAAMRRAPHPSHDHSWAQERANFVHRHMKQYVKHPTYRRWLALLMWAYRPPGRIPEE